MTCSPTAPSRAELPDDAEVAQKVFAAQAAVAVKNARLFEEVSHLSHQLQEENSYLKEEINAAYPTHILGQSAAIASAVQLLDRVASTSATVLLLGETGTGELPLEAQAKLLRVLQDRELERVGGSETIRVDAPVQAQELGSLKRRDPGRRRRRSGSATARAPAFFAFVRWHSACTSRIAKWKRPPKATASTFASCARARRT
jgi:hypothetical protein